MKKNDKRIIWLGLIVSLFFVFVFFITKDFGQKESYSPEFATSTNQTKNIDQAFLEINGEKIGTVIDRNTFIYEFMMKLQKEEKINFKDKTYSGMGKLIEEINGVKNSGEKNWIYYVNNKKAEIGVSNYKIKPGDVVSWKYEEDIN